jgi:hypothetical protein
LPEDWVDAVISPLERENNALFTYAPVKQNSVTAPKLILIIREKAFQVKN